MKAWIGLMRQEGGNLVELRAGELDARADGYARVEFREEMLELSFGEATRVWGVATHYGVFDDEGVLRCAARLCMPIFVTQGTRPFFDLQGNPGMVRQVKWAMQDKC
jgi:hypothetical protein